MVFNNLNDFIDKTKTLDVNNSVNLKSIIDFWHGLNKGCGCTRSHRQNQINNLYQIFYQRLNPEEIQLLKTFFKVEEIIFKDGEKELGKI